jgi:choice-of-anchor B domain-containing protein
MRLFLTLAFCFISIIVTDAQNLQLRSVTTYPSDMSDVWGYTDGEREYALATYEDGWSVVDVTDPGNPEKLHDIPGPNTFWRDIKTYGHYAYGIHEDVGFLNEGLIIMDLSQLPDELPVSYWTGSGQSGVNFKAAHNIFMDENGIAYISGHNMGGGVMMIDVAANPINPSYLGMYNDEYVHDCFARNDTLWTAEVYSGEFSIINVRSKSNPIVLARQPTPLNFTHNLWVSDDGKTVFTTDERTGAFLAAYDITNVQDIRELDRYRSASNVIPHNAFVKDEFVVASWYSHGVIILDASFPDELVEVGRFDTAPNFPGPGFHGAWGVYPYLPSGNILVTDIEEGLVVLTPEYRNAAHIRGRVIDASSLEIISGAQVIINGPGGENEQLTTLDGIFKRGSAEGGIFTVEVSKLGYESQVIEIDLADGETSRPEIELEAIAYQPSDTIYAEVMAGQREEICTNNGIVAETAISCGGLTSSNSGSWAVNVVNGAACMVYNANGNAGGSIDEICLVEFNENTDSLEATLVIVSILSGVTGVEENGFGNGAFSLASNPVSHILQIISKDSREHLTAEIFDLQGRSVISRSFEGRQAIINVAVPDLPEGLYLLSLADRSGRLGSAKFIKE